MIDDVFVNKVESIITDMLKRLGASRLQKENSPRATFIRALLPRQFAPAPGDQFQHGIAFAIWADKGIEVCPYVIRHVCANGMVISHTFLAAHVVDAKKIPEYDLSAKLMDAMIACGAKQLRDKIEKTVISSLEQPGNLRQVFHRLSSFTQWQQRTTLLNQIVKRLDPWDRTSLYNIMNAITSLARDSEDADLKWNLEKLGWEVLLGSQPTKVARYAKETEEPVAFE